MALAALALGLQILSTGESILQGSKAADEQKERAAIGQAQQKIDRDREQRREFREERVRRATLEQAAANTGTSGSSGELGASAVLSTNIASNEASRSGRILASDAMTSSAQRGANAQYRGQLASSFAQLSGQVFNYQMSTPAGRKKFTSLFGE